MAFQSRNKTSHISNCPHSHTRRYRTVVDLRPPRLHEQSNQRCALTPRRKWRPDDWLDSGVRDGCFGRWWLSSSVVLAGLDQFLAWVVKRCYSFMVVAVRLARLMCWKGGTGGVVVIGYGVIGCRRYLRVVLGVGVVWRYLVRPLTFCLPGGGCW